MLSGKIAIVTGASRGIGEAVAKKLGKLGATVIVNYCGSFERAEKVKEDIVKDGGDAKTYKCDISDFAACETFFKEVAEEYGKMRMR